MLGRRQERDCWEWCSSTHTLVYLLFASPVPLPLLPLSPHPRTVRTLWGQGGEGMGQRGWNEVNLHYFLPPLPFHSSCPIPPPIPLCPPLSLWNKLLSSPSLGLARVVERLRGRASPTRRQLEAELVPVPAQPGQDEAAQCSV